MLVRLSLIIAILAGGAAFYFTHDKVQEKIVTLESDLQQKTLSEQSARDAQRRAETDRKKAVEDLADANRMLNQTTNALATTTGRLQEQLTRANRLADDLSLTTQQRNEAQEELAQWRAIGLTVRQVLDLRDGLNRVRGERDAFIAENKILNRSVQELSAELQVYTRGGAVELPDRLRGRVIAADHRYNFVVIDKGQEDGVLENGELLVSRDGRLVGRVRIAKVNPRTSIANIISDWNQEGLDEVQEGDLVLP